MDQLFTRITDLLEEYAGKVRAMTVDRLRGSITKTSIGITATTLALFAAVVIVRGLFRLLAVAVTEPGAYAIVGGIFVIIGAFIWAKRDPSSTEAESPHA